MTFNQSLTPRQWKRLASNAIIIAAFAHNLFYSWLKWGDVLVDCGRELDVAQQLSEGRRLYVDMRYWFGPLAPWIDGMLFGIFGAHTGVLMASGIVCAAVTCIILYRLTRQFASRTCATCVAVLFLYACAFAHLVKNGIFNFVLPYGQCATYGILVCLLSVFFLIRYLKKERRRDFACSLAFLALSALTKMELFAAVVLTHGAAMAGFWWARRLKPFYTAAGYAAAAAAIVGAYGMLAARVGRELFTDNLLVQFNPALYSYTMVKSGLADWPRSLRQMAYSALALIAVASVLVATAIIAERPAFKRWRASLAFACVATASGAYLLLSVDLAFRVITPMALLVLISLALNGRRDLERRAAIAPHLTLWTFALACLSRLALRPVSYHYGFYMLVPSLAALGVFWFEYLPRCTCWVLQRRPVTAPPARWTFTLGGAAVFAGLAATHFRISSQFYARHTVELRTPNAHMFILDRIDTVPEGRCYAEAIRLLNTLPPETKVLAVPQGVGLLFCAGLRNTYGSGAFLPPEVAGSFDDDHLAARLQARPPDLVIRTWEDPEDFGLEFGKDYARNTWLWIMANYKFAFSLGTEDFPLLRFYYRKGAPDPFPDVRPKLSAP